MNKVRQGRHFELRLLRLDLSEHYGFLLVETFGDVSEPIVSVGVEHAKFFRRAVTGAVKESGYLASAVSAQRRTPFALKQEPGVRLALAALTALPVVRTERRRTIVARIESMSSEEALYWYSKTTGPEGKRALRALRLLLADDRPETPTPGTPHNVVKFPQRTV